MIVSNEKELRMSCEQATPIEAIEIAEKLKIELEIYPGYGLAANQIGIQKRICFIWPTDNKEYILCNPVIIEQSKPFIFQSEGCLSIENGHLRKNTKRYKQVRIIDDFHPEGLTANDLEAVVLQHEIGHLNGELFLDYVVKDVGRNEKCPCGSNKKWKKCCGKSK